MNRLLKLVLALGIPLTAMAQTGPQIPLTGSIGVPGSVATLGWNAVSMTDANYTLTSTQWAVYYQQLTSSVSLTATRKLILPLQTGQTYAIHNLTTGGQTICAGASTGACVSILYGQTIPVYCDGTNYSTLPLTGSYYQTVQSNGSSVAQRTNLNFGSGFTLTDSSSPSTTTVNITATSGTVTSFSSGNLLTGGGVPFWTTSVTGSTSAVVQTFTLANAPTEDVFGNCTGSIQPPNWCNITVEMLPFTYTGNTTNVAVAAGAFINGDGITTDPQGNFIDTNSPAGKIVSVTASAPITATTTSGAVALAFYSGTTAGCPNIGGTIVCITANGLVTSYGAPYAITSFSCTASGNFEIGYSSTNPNTCTYAYANGTTASATLSDGVHSTVNLTAPYTSGNLAYAYTANTTFTGNATATNSQTASATASFSVSDCTFSGLGTGGAATGATASGSGTGNQCASETATLSGATATLASNGLGNTYAGQTFNLSPSGQYIYLLLTGGCSHTLTVNSFTTTFNTHALTYTNILGGSQTGMCIYSSPTNYTGIYTVVVSSL